MKNRILSLLAALLMASLLLMAGIALADTDDTAADSTEAADTVIALVNGEALTQSAFVDTEATYMIQYAQLGLDLTDESVLAYVEDLALTAAIEDMLVTQDMQAQGFFDFDEETENWMIEQGTAAYESALADVGEVLRSSLDAAEDEDMSTYALAYAQVLGVTAENYIDVYRQQMATMHYYAWLIQDTPITDEDVQAAFDAQLDGGEQELTDDVYDELAYQLYVERYQAALRARIDVLSDAAEVVIY